MNAQKKLRTDVIQLEDTLAQVRKEYEMLRIEFEQNLAANEQAGKIGFFFHSPPQGFCSIGFDGSFHYSHDMGQPIVDGNPV